MRELQEERKLLAGWLAGWRLVGSWFVPEHCHSSCTRNYKYQCVFFREARSTRLGGGIYSRRLIRDFQYFR